jgi:hypothetical protein
MLAVYAVEGTYDEVPALVRRKYAGLIDRVSFYALPTLERTDPAAWRRLMDACRA